MSGKPAKLSKASGSQRKTAHRKGRLAKHARRQLVRYLLALGVFGVGVQLAAEMPETLNQLSCWCVCDVCMAGAEVAWEMSQRGITDPAKVQPVLDVRFGRSS